MEGEKFADNWPFKTDNDKEALELGRAIIQVLQRRGAQIVLTRRKFYIEAVYRCHELGRQYSHTQSAWNENSTIAGGMTQASINTELAIASEAEAS